MRFGRRKRRKVVQIIAVGVASGFLSGIFGVGGGTLIVPGLLVVLRLEQRLAHGTSLAAIIPIAAAGTIGYALDDKVDWQAALYLLVGAATIGAVVGTYLLHVLPRRGLALGFAGIMLLTAVRMGFDQSDAIGRDDVTVAMALGLFAIGVVAGTLAGLLGVGGGIVMVPAMVLVVGIPAVVAKGTSLAVIIPTAVVGTLRNRARRNADVGIAMAVGASGVVSSFAASQLSVGLDERLSNRLFALLLVIVAVKLVTGELRNGATGPSVDV